MVVIEEIPTGCCDLIDLSMKDIPSLEGISLEEEAEEVELEEVDDEDEDEDEDEEEEEEVVEYVTLGILKKPKHPTFLLRQLFPSKSGGVPAWLDPEGLPSGKSCRCGFCDQPLQFLLQIYAPTEQEHTFHRMMYVFICPSMSCLLQDQHEQWKHSEDNPRRSVKIFRCQLPQSNRFYSNIPPRHDGTDKPSSRGAALCSWCGTWKGDKVCSSCKRARYCSKEHQAMHWNSEHKNQCRQIIHHKSSSADSSVACSTLWPEYEIAIENECAFDTETYEENTRAASLEGKFEGDDDKRNRASFQERIAKCPNQVLRYFRDATAKPLWPLSIGRPSISNIPKCNYCNGPLCYEFQIMPQLLYYNGVKNNADSLDFGTIAVYACLASCESSGSYKEEFAWVQLYPTTSMI